MNNYSLKLAPQSGAASWVSAWIPVSQDGWRLASLTVAWGAVAATAGALSIEGTDDPGGTAAVPLTVATSHGTWPTVGATASAALVVLTNCPGWIRVRYTRTAGGGADQFQTYGTLTE